MKKTLTLLLCAATLLVRAQAPHCHTDEKRAAYLAQHPEVLPHFDEVRQQILALRDELQNEMDGSGRSQMVITIPVVFHVIHPNQSIGTGLNLSEAQLLSQLDALNRDYRKRNADTALIPSVFQGLNADVRVEFCLATTDPNGNPTTGITRHSYTNTNNFDTNIKPATQWDWTRYLNIWTTVLTGSVLGYATIPGMFPDDQDGVVLDYRYVGLPPANPFPTDYELGRTCVHEVGHWLGLYHTFEGGCAGTADTNCAYLGDYNCDTPPSFDENFGCPNLANPPNTCTESPVDKPDMYMNYMDYSNDECLYMFTHGQRDIMRATIFTYRPGLLASLGCNTNNTFTFSGQVVDAQTNQGVANAVVLLDGGDETEVTTDGNGNFSIPNVQEGYYDLYAGKWGYSTRHHLQNVFLTSATTQPQVPIQNNVYYDDFVLNLGWTTSGNATTGEWVRALPVGTVSGGKAANPELDEWFDLGVKCYVTGNGGGTGTNDDVDNGNTVIQSPYMDLTSFADPVVRYKRWFFNGPQSGSTPDDFMRIKISNGTNIVTIDNATDNNGEHNQWEEKIIHLNQYVSITSSMRLIVEVSDINNQNVTEGAIDKVAVTDGVVSADELMLNEVLVYPNPAKDILTIQTNSSEAMETSVQNMLGETVLLKTAKGTAQLDMSSQPVGVYFLHIAQQGASKTVKISVQP